MKRFFLALLLIGLVACSDKGLNYGPYSIGRDESWFPLDLGSQTENLTAFSTALVQEIAKLEQIPLHLLNVDWIQIFEVLDKGELGGILTSLPPNLITNSKYSFSSPIIELGPVLVVPTASKAKTLADLKEKLVGVYQYDESVQLAQQVPSIVIQLYQNKPTILEDLVEGKLDAVLMPVLDAQLIVPFVYPNHLKIVSEPLNTKAIRLVTLKDKNSSLIKYFNRGLEKLRASGKYQELRQTYKLKPL